MKITRSRLRQIIKEEVSNLLSEADYSNPAAIEGLCPAIYTHDGNRGVETVEVGKRYAFATNATAGQYTTNILGVEMPAWEGYDQRPLVVGTVMEIDLGWPASIEKVQVVHKPAHVLDPQPSPVMSGCGTRGRIILSDYNILE